MLRRIVETVDYAMLVTERFILLRVIASDAINVALMMTRQVVARHVRSCDYAKIGHRNKIHLP
jgi:hypothetical protein